MNAAEALARTHPACPLGPVPGECMAWSGAVQSSGYASIGNGRGGTALAHRMVWEELRGEIQADLTIDHLCRTKLCLNVEHMELVTRGENTRRALATQTHCKAGHPLSGANVRLTRRSRTGHVHRVCVTCQRANARASYRRLRGLEVAS